MPFSETFTDGLTVVVGDPTKASHHNNLSNNTDALKERYAIDHVFNNTGVDGSDGHHKGDFTASMFLKNDAGYFAALWIDNTITPVALRVKIGTSKVNATPASVTDGNAIVAGATSAGATF